ncbi:MAG: 4-hydroxythreonine-4-phosphate dehydrogenase PdxA [Limnobacter sp.]|nr:4-hydroxythreonine-4-phosphate dehydrogenase PdxA [Limnobacter sp.]
MIKTPILISSGEPAGIGPELCGLLAEGAFPSDFDRPIVFVGDLHLLNARCAAIDLTPNWKEIEILEQIQTLGFYVMHVPLYVPCATGQINSKNGRYVLDILDYCVDECMEDRAAALVTAPIQKSAISPIWRGFQGHTEYLADRCNVDQVVMMLAGGGLKVALATTHLPLTEVSQAITKGGLTRTLEILLESLKANWGLPKPRVLVTGLNPHAGESGTMGREEVDTITPVIEHFQSQGEAVTGPYPADTLFQPKYLKNADAVLAMFHDQGLPVLKFASFGEGVNITLGLPIIRTSVDHGTALDLAGTRNMNSGSLNEALRCALQMANNKEQSDNKSTMQPPTTSRQQP